VGDRDKFRLVGRKATILSVERATPRNAVNYLTDHTVF
jgi:hypothetical protein